MHSHFKLCPNTQEIELVYFITELKKKLFQNMTDEPSIFKNMVRI